MNGNCFR
jgi:hypothetical protein